MGVVALCAWAVTVLLGIVLLMIWLMEYDREFQTAAATRLPVPVISAHALLGLGGLMVWGFYLVTDSDTLEWATIVDLGVVASLGLLMAARWVGVYRAYAAPDSSSFLLKTVPPERHFPRPVIVVHGLAAAATIGLVVFTAFFSGS